MSDRGVNEAQDKRNIFQSLATGAPMSEVMRNYQKTEAEIMGVFRFVSLKIRSYRLERGMPWAQCDTVQSAMKNWLIIAHTLARVNLASEPKFKSISTFDLDPTKPLSEGEQRLLSLQSRMRK